MSRQFIVKVTVSVALFIGLLNAQSIPAATITPAAPLVPQYTSTTRALRFYGDDIRINWAANLGCGACINGGYTFCIQGKEGDDYTGKTIVSQCCRDSSAANCPVISNTAYTCSNVYTDRTAAKNICPFKTNTCGPQGLYKYSFYGSSQRNNINVNLLPGETCAYQIATECGLPMFQPSTTAGFDIEMVDYDNSDIKNLRFLQAITPKPATTTTTTTTPPTATPTPSFTPAPPKRLARTTPVPRRSFITRTSNGTSKVSSTDIGSSGVMAGRFRPDYDGSQKVFKGGEMGFFDFRCTQRNTMVYVTNLQGVNVTVPTTVFNENQRILQSLPPAPVPNTMMLTVGSVDFSGSLSRIISTAVFLLASLALMF